LLRGEDEVFRQSLDDADAWLAAYYADDSAGVRSARETIAELRDSVFQVAMPDISGSLRMLRQFNALSEAAADTDSAAESGPEQ
jgi:uroporphyrin-3 C-methyltransferase